tara:strand:+ start:104 stop:256 length:153 start_codon:yes stop_codon:yes gene_type:complete
MEFNSIINTYNKLLSVTKRYNSNKPEKNELRNIVVKKGGKNNSKVSVVII